MSQAGKLAADLKNALRCSELEIESNIYSRGSKYRNKFIGLFKACVSRIWISHFCTIDVEFINGITIKNLTERKNENAQCAECNDNSCESAECGKQG